MNSSSVCVAVSCLHMSNSSLCWQSPRSPSKHSLVASPRKPSSPNTPTRKSSSPNTPTRIQSKPGLRFIIVLWRKKHIVQGNSYYKEIGTRNECVTIIPYCYYYYYYYYWYYYDWYCWLSIIRNECDLIKYCVFIFRAFVASYSPPLLPGQQRPSSLFSLPVERLTPSSNPLVQQYISTLVILHSLLVLAALIIAMHPVLFTAVRVLRFLSYHSHAPLSLY